ncbi:MAG: protein translocase subunit SecD [Phycisphaerales bacterium JB052]
MRHYGRNIIIAFALILLALWQAFPPSERIGLGKDLRGGASLIYSVEIGSTESASEVIPQVIDVLKKRIDPDGLFEISIVRQGQDRIEITMPLPSDKVKELKEAFEAELAKLSVTSIDENEFERIMRLAQDERDAKLAELGQVSETVNDALRQAASAFTEAQQLRQQLILFEQNTDIADDIKDELAIKAADAEIRYEVARDAALATAISREEVKRALERSTEQKTIRDGDEVITLDSPRKRALDGIRAQYPEIEDQLNRVIEAYDEYSANRKSLDDTSDLKRLVQASGVLSFRITVDPQSGGAGSVVTHPDEQRLREQLVEKGPKQAGARDARWFKINKADSWYKSVQDFDRMIADPASYFASNYNYVVEEYNGDYYMLCWDTRDMRMTNDDARWKVSRAYQTSDQLGRPAIGFEMDPAGAARLGELTGNNEQNNMAVLLDDEVYTAPNLNARITNRGIIEGDFSIEEINYIIRVLGAGSLQAKLSPEPLSENTIAPELGQDNLDAGVDAGKWALIIVSGFMLVYYMGYGFVAVLCLAANAILILGALALSRASLTLPGIAGIILTFGMAVDANVLIFERIREEINNGLDLRQAVRLGYEKALSSIVDGNVTNLIVCLVLANVGTQEIRGFAITLGIGVVCTMVSALFFSHIIMVTLVDKLRFRKMSMLPMIVKPIERILNPNINWIGLRWVTVFVSLFFVGLGITMVITQGSKMLDTEFRGGTQVTLTFKKNADTPDPDDRLTMPRPEVEEIIHALGDDNIALEAMRNAEVLPINPREDGLTADTFSIKTTITNRDQVGPAIVSAFRDLLDVPPPLEFQDSQVPDSSAAPVYPIIEPRLGENINLPEVRNDATEFVGGVAIVLNNISPPQSEDQIRDRIARTRQKDDFSDIVGRKISIVTIDGTPDEIESCVIMVYDPTIDYFVNADIWRSEVAQREWELIAASLANSSDQLSVQSFSPAIAENFRATAVAAVMLSLLLILIYIWVRFGSVRYSAAAIVALAHDVLIVIGLIAFAEIMYEHHIFDGFAQWAKIEPFKIDLNLVAALLTLIGYSLNDTIVIMDRIRENRGKLPYASKAVVNRSINETISRTLVTSGTTLLAVLLLYIDGGPGVHAFSYALLVGVLVGTYSSIAVASPLVWSRRHDLSERRRREEEELNALPSHE